MAKQKGKIDGGFIILPKRTIKCKQWKALTVYDRATYLAMLTEFIRDKTLNPEFKVKITYLQIVDIVGFSESEVKRCIQRLKKHDFIRVETQGGLARRYSVYTLNPRYLW